jgi:aminopeptidase N
MVVLLAACSASSPGVSVAPATPSPAQGTKGAPGVGDALFPNLGNGGYDVQSYDVSLSPDPASGVLTATVKITAVATQALSSFDLDLVGMTVDSVAVDGRRAAWSRSASELVVQPAAAVTDRSTFIATVSYHGVPGADRDPTGVEVGWIRTGPQSWYVMNEPDGAREWLVSNDHPSDKASFTFHITVPRGLTAVANGDLVSTKDQGDRTTWSWHEAAPMATYLTQVAIGDYELHDGTGPHGLRIQDAVLRKDASAVQPCIAHDAELIAGFEPLFGPYPFTSYGALVGDSMPGLAVEQQTRSMFSASDLLHGCPTIVLAHELSHQWFGDAVSPARWQDVWLNEGFATFAETVDTLQSDPARYTTLLDDMRDAVASSRSVDGPPAMPTRASLFGNAVYSGGAVALEALRREVGSDTFFAILRTWVKRYDGKSVTTSDFVAVASEVAGHDLSAFMQPWLYGSAVPQYP